MKKKIEIKSWYGSVLFSYKKENNTIKDTLEDAVLRGAVLRGADLRGAVLSGADLREFKNDLFEILLESKREVPALREKIILGEVDGSVYEGPCCCLVGTIANIKGCSYTSIDGIVPNSSRPAEKWFLGIKEGDTPETNQISKITLEWIDEFLKLIEA